VDGPEKMPADDQLIPCEACGQAVAVYRSTCPFCGAPTGRQEAAPPGSAPHAEQPKKSFPWRSLIVPLVLVACVAVAAGVLAIARSNSEQTTGSLSPEASAFIQRAMPALDKVMAEAQAGNDTQAAADWDALGEMPALTPADLSVAVKYTAYANAVRGYLLQDGSVTQQQVEAAKKATDSAIAAVKAP
jgi:hypothetical protein